VLTVALIALLIKLGPALKTVSPWVAIAALALTNGCVSAPAFVDPVSSDTRRPRAVALRRALPKRSADAPGDRRLCTRGAPGDCTLREADAKPLTSK